MTTSFRSESIRKIKRNKTPPITLRGIVGRTAMLEMKNELYFVQEGDSLATGRITYIYPDSVIIEFEDKKETLRVRK